jgi:hypothetical protein
LITIINNTINHNINKIINHITNNIINHIIVYQVYSFFFFSKLFIIITKKALTKYRKLEAKNPAAAKALLRQHMAGPSSLPPGAQRCRSRKLEAFTQNVVAARLTEKKFGRSDCAEVLSHWDFREKMNTQGYKREGRRR